MKLLVCTRNGCGAQFDANAPQEDVVCRYHPGNPVFHEGLKGWSCCKTNFTDFSEFLAHPGCQTESGHDATPKTKVKKAEAEAHAPELKHDAPIDDGLGSHHIDREIPMERPVTSEKIAVEITETESAKKSFARALKSHQDRVAQDTSSATSAEKGASTQIKVGNPCLRNACGKRYVDEASLMEACIYHQGTPVFHEGMKFWSCCNHKKFTEFDDCMSHQGCTEGKCKFIPTAEDIARANKVKCRYDYMQTPEHITVTIYAKAVDKEKLVVKCSVTDLEVSLMYKFTSSFDLNVSLSGCVDPERSKVTIYGTKIEIALKKGDGCAWETLGEEMALA